MKRIARTGGIVVGVLAAIAGLLLLLKDRISGPPRIPLDEPSPFRAPPPAEEPVAADDLSEIKGIGPVYRSRLDEAGITGFAALAAAAPNLIADRAGVSERMAAGWIAQATEIARR